MLSWTSQHERQLRCTSWSDHNPVCSIKLLVKSYRRPPPYTPCMAFTRTSSNDDLHLQSSVIISWIYRVPQKSVTYLPSILSWVTIAHSWWTGTCAHLLTLPRYQACVWGWGSVGSSWSLLYGRVCVWSELRRTLGLTAILVHWFCLPLVHSCNWLKGVIMETISDFKF